MDNAVLRHSQFSIRQGPGVNAIQFLEQLLRRGRGHRRTIALDMNESIPASTLEVQRCPVIAINSETSNERSGTMRTQESLNSPLLSRNFPAPAGFREACLPARPVCGRPQYAAATESEKEVSATNRRTILERSLAAIACLAVLNPAGAVDPPATADRSPSQASAATRPAYYPGQIEGDQRILHALNRFTFGPRPGDLEAVRALSLDRWFDQQLHPATIEQSELNARLAQYPAMRLRSEELLYRMPSNAVIRQVLAGKVPVPEQDPLRAVYENQMSRVAEKKQEKQNEGQQTQNAAPAKGAKTAMASNEAAAKLLDSLDSDGEDARRANEMAGQSPSEMNPSRIAALLALPPPQRISRLSAMQPAEFDEFFKSLKGPQRADLISGLTPEIKETVGALENPQRTVAEELIAQRLTRDIYSSAQLQEVMTDFWFNHFNVYLRKNEAMPYYLVSYERDAIRPHALGKFEDLLDATAHSPAMLLYLDNAESVGPNSRAADWARMNMARNADHPKKAQEGLNENYARELMELHTLGVNGGYTQADVIQVARILTGWTVDRPQRGGGFVFNPNRHEPGTKKALGKKFKENGEGEGRDLLHFLATRPATAQFVSRKLAVRFVSDDPPERLVERMSKSYLSSGGDIAVVLKTMFHSPEFWSISVYRAKVKTPLEYVVSAARASNADITNLRPLANALREMGMPLYGAIPPTGYKWDASDWISTEALVKRMNFALSLAGNRLPGISTTWSSRESQTLATRPNPQAEESRLELILIAGAVSDSTRSALLDQFTAQNTNGQAAEGQPRAQSMAVSENRTLAPAEVEKQDRLLAGLLLGSPEFQRR
jgi:uncharacterized protein (DUF1800 family)